jgi:hypothetical protein
MNEIKQNPRLFAALLLVSWVLNLGLLGCCLGYYWQPTRMDVPHHGFNRILQQLPASAKQRLQPHTTTWLQLRQQLHQAKQQIVISLQTEPFDRQQLQQAVENFNHQRQKLHQLTQPLLIDIIAQLNLAERQQLAQNMAMRANSFKP